jgi:hypothetical protein
MKAVMQLTQNDSASTSATSAEVMHDISGDLVRTMLVITNTSVAAVVTICKGNVPAVQGSGIRLAPSGSYMESSDGGFTCWQGSIQAVSDVAGSIGLVQTFEKVN